MATSGKVVTNTTYDSYFWVKWEQIGSQDTVNNRTLIKWSCGVYCGHSFYSNAIKMSGFYINGSLVYSGGTYSNYSPGDHEIASGTLYISHNTDGTKTFNISSFTGWLYSSHNYSAEATSHTLTTIPRGATITEASDFNDTDNPIIKISNPGGFRMDVWLEPNPVGDHLCVRTNIATDNTGKFTWTLTDTERDALRNKCAGKSCTIRLGLYTYIGNTTYTSYVDKTYTMTENSATKPGVTIGIAPSNGSLPSAFSELYVQGKSRVGVRLTLTEKYGAGIISCSCTVDGKATNNARTFTSDVIQSSGSVKITASAKDARGFSGSAERTINVVEYSKPKVEPLSGQNAVLCYRSDANGKMDGNSTSVRIKAQRSYSSVSGNNYCSLQYRCKLSTEAWSSSKHPWIDLISRTSTGNQFNALLSGEEFDLMQSYTIQIRAVDDIGEQDIKTFEVPTKDVALHLGEGGKKVAIGSYCGPDDYTFYCAWKARFSDDIIINGMTLKDYIKSVINEGG